MALSANELRIGIFVKDPTNKITQIFSGEDINMHNLFSPIPLTEEWLLKLGLAQDDLYDHIFWINYNFMKTFTIEKVKLYYQLPDYDIEIKYVHQLQNLYFALTGEELTLNKKG